MDFEINLLRCCKSGSIKKVNVKVIKSKCVLVNCVLKFTFEVGNESGLSVKELCS